MSAIWFLIVTLFAIAGIFVGFFYGALAGNHPQSVVCMLGDAVLDNPGQGNCNKFIYESDGVTIKGKGGKQGVDLDKSGPIEPTLNIKLRPIRSILRWGV